MPSDRGSASATVTHPARRGRKYFTVAEANRALTYVNRVVEDITLCYKRTLVLRDRLEHPHPEDLQDEIRGEYEKSMDQLSNLVDELHHVGVELKDFEKGLIDFPALHEGREINLCWHRGETEIAYWHELEAGYAGRQAVALLLDK